MCFFHHSHSELHAACASADVYHVHPREFACHKYECHLPGRSSHLLCVLQVFGMVNEQRRCYRYQRSGAIAQDHAFAIGSGRSRHALVSEQEIVRLECLSTYVREANGGLGMVRAMAAWLVHRVGIAESECCGCNSLGLHLRRHEAFGCTGEERPSRFNPCVLLRVVETSVG